VSLARELLSRRGFIIAGPEWAREAPAVNLDRLALGVRQREPAIARGVMDFAYPRRLDLNCRGYQLDMDYFLFDRVTSVLRAGRQVLSQNARLSCLLIVRAHDNGAQGQRRISSAKLGLAHAWRYSRPSSART